MAEHVCPVWVGYLLASPLRKLLQNPRKILGPHVRKNMSVLDVGCAMGFFSLPLARLVGPGGTVICVDFQEKMLTSLRKRAEKAGLDERIETRLCRRDSLDLDDLSGRIDFALAFAVVHEVPDPARLFSEIHEAMKPTAGVLVAEPKGQVSAEEFETSISIAEQNGFERIERPRIRRGNAILLAKKARDPKSNTNR